MNIRFRLIASIFLGAAMWVLSQQAWALGLGEIQVESYLGQPLEARIDLITRSTDDLKSVTAQLASAEDYASIGASREAISTNITFEVEESDSGAWFIDVSSRQAVKDPVIRLIVELTWKNGRMFREYTVFLDPPMMAEAARAPRIEQKAPSQQAASQSPEPVTRPAEPQQGSFDSSDKGEYGPVQSGETLWRIASDWSSDSGLDVNKVMIAIQKKNPQAFLNDNINLLKRGAVLRMPEFSEVQSLSTAVARDEVLNQVDAYQQRSAMAGSATPLLADEAAAIPRASTQDPETTEAAQRLATEQLATEKLELVPPSEDTLESSAPGFEEGTGQSGALVELAALREELSRKEEELLNEQQQNLYLKERLSELESQVSAAASDALSDNVTEELAAGEVADASLAQMENRLREERLAEAGGQEAVTEQPAQAAQTVPQVITADEEKPWYSGIAMWLIALLVLAAAVAGWFMSRREEPEIFISDLGQSEKSEAVRDIASEAEEILHVLEPEAGDTEVLETPARAESSDQAENVVNLEGHKEEHAASPNQEESLLDEESADPEIQLDLARAYLAMGDKEAARSNLEEVLVNGNEEQQADARAMMSEI